MVTLLGLTFAALACAEADEPTMPLTPQTKPAASFELVIDGDSERVLPIGDSIRLKVLAKSNGQVIPVPGGLLWNALEPWIADIDESGLVHGLAAGDTRAVVSSGALADTVVIHVQQVAQVPPSLTPEALVPVVGPLILRNSVRTDAVVRQYDDVFARTEALRFREYLRCEAECYLLAQHYGGLRSRLSWAIRNREPFGAGVADEARSAYARGIRIVRRYLEYSRRARFVVPVQNNTGLADVEALYVLEGDEDARTHIHVTAANNTHDPYNYQTLQNRQSGARIPAIALQAFNAAHRLGIPYATNDANTQVRPNDASRSWTEAGRSMVRRMEEAGAIQRDGTIISPSNGAGTETYFMNAMLATELLRWHGYVEPQPHWVDLARRIVDHLIDVRNTKHRGLAALPYTSASRAAAEDLAAYYVWPSLVLWQETGDEKYREFALWNMAASIRAKTLSMLKQWNQVFSTGAQSAEALLAGVSWR